MIVDEEEEEGLEEELEEKEGEEEEETSFEQLFDNDPFVQNLHNCCNPSITGRYEHFEFFTETSSTF
jgi:hypothetical protein